MLVRPDVVGGPASPSTIHGLELSHPGLAEGDRYCRIGPDQEAVDELLIDLFLASCDEPPSEVILDLDATEDPIHGEQQGRFFHGYYDCYCYMPLYIFAGDHLSCARLRPANQDGAAGSLEELERIVDRIRAAWPETRIVVRADSGFCREWLMAWLEAKNVDYVLGGLTSPRSSRCCTSRSRITPSSPSTSGGVRERLPAQGGARGLTGPGNVDRIPLGNWGEVLEPTWRLTPAAGEGFCTALMVNSTSPS